MDNTIIATLRTLGMQVIEAESMYNHAITHCKSEDEQLSIQTRYLPMLMDLKSQYARLFVAYDTYLDASIALHAMTCNAKNW